MRLRSEDKHHLRKSADRNTHISPVSNPEFKSLLAYDETNGVMTCRRRFCLASNFDNNFTRGCRDLQRSALVRHINRSSAKITTEQSLTQNNGKRTLPGCEFTGTETSRYLAILWCRGLKCRGSDCSPAVRDETIARPTTHANPIMKVEPISSVMNTRFQVIKSFTSSRGNVLQ